MWRSRHEQLRKLTSANSPRTGSANYTAGFDAFVLNPQSSPVRCLYHIHQLYNTVVSCWNVYIYIHTYTYIYLSMYLSIYLSISLLYASFRMPLPPSSHLLAPTSSHSSPKGTPPGWRSWPAGTAPFGLSSHFGLPGDKQINTQLNR